MIAIRRFLPTGATVGRASTAAACRRCARPLAIACLVALVVAGCSNSKLVIGPLYNRLDNRLEARFTELADFSDTQLAHAQRLIGTFHVWHRQSELPRYANFLQRVSASLLDLEPISRVDVETWYATVQHHIARVRSCHPVNFAADLMRTFTDEQLSDARHHVAERHAERVARYRERSPEERRQARVERFVGWAKRIGVELNREQRDRLRTTLARQISLREQHFAGSSAWSEGFFELLEARASASFEPRLKAHLATMYTWLQTAHAETWQANQTLWQDSLLELIHSLTPSQRQNAAAWMRKMAATLNAVAADEPGFRVDADPALGCLVASDL